MPKKSGLSAIDDESFYDIFEEVDHHPALIAAVIIEARRRDVEIDQIDALLEKFVTASMAHLSESYDDLFSLYWNDAMLSKKEFIDYAHKYLAEISDEEPDWPWPVTDLRRDGGGGRPLSDLHPMSGLAMCGYHVGKKGMEKSERIEFLDHFFRSRLPSCVEKHFGDEYAEPGSERRLKKMANVIAAICRIRKSRSDAYIFHNAIADWEHDLAYLRRIYYRAGTFPWPEI